jgi:hypothetical protein
LQYYIHRFILHPQNPNTISQLHLSYFHSIKSPYSFAAHYDHPTSYVLLRFLPIYLPAILFRDHLLTYLMTLSIITLEETLTFSGYSVIPGIMIGGIARRQDLHSKSHGRGNFAPLGVMDWIHGTSIGADLIDDVRDEAANHQVGERSRDAIEGAKDSGRRGLRSWSNRNKSSKRS